MARKRLVFHLVPIKDGWAVKLGGIVIQEFLRERGETKEQAIKYAVPMAIYFLPSQLVIHKQDGRIQSERTYGDDPVRSKG